MRLSLYTVLKVIEFPRYNMKCSGGNDILHGIFCVVSRFLYISCITTEILVTVWTVYQYFLPLCWLECHVTVSLIGFPAVCAGLNIVPLSLYQDFLPSVLVGYFTSTLSAIPSLLEFIPEVSESLADGALWFNFVFGKIL